MPIIKLNLFTLVCNIRLCLLVSPSSFRASNRIFSQNSFHQIFNIQILFSWKFPLTAPSSEELFLLCHSSPYDLVVQNYDYLIFFSFVCLLIYCLCPNVSQPKRGELNLFFAVSQCTKCITDI